MAESLQYRGELIGHKGAITAIATHRALPDFVISASRDKSVIVWKLKIDQVEGTFGSPVKRLVGHNHFVSDIALASDDKDQLFLLSGSWDNSLRLWNIEDGSCTKRFVGHTKDVLSVAFSPDNRRIVSSSRDKTIKVWNIYSECRFTINERNNGHNDWVSCVRFSPSNHVPILVSCGWDKLVKVFNMETLSCQFNLTGHTGYVNTVTVSPDGTLCASGGKDGSAKLWDITGGKHLYSLESHDVINALAFSPVRYWLCVATNSNILVWDLETKVLIHTIAYPETGVGVPCTTLAWSTDGSVLYAGYGDNTIRAYSVVSISNE